MSKIRIAHGLTGFKCECCGLDKNTVRVYDIKQVLTIDHVLTKKVSSKDPQACRVICANCHAHTITYNCNKERLATLNGYVDTIPTNVDYSKIKMVPAGGEADFNYKNYGSLFLRAETVKKLNKDHPAFERRKRALEIGEGRKSRGKILGYLISTGEREGKCEICGLTEWRGLPISLIISVHHKDENTRNNKLSNIQLICQNCHRGEHIGIAEHQKVDQTHYPIESKLRILKPRTDFRLRQMYALLNHPNRPLSMSACAKLLGWNPDRFRVNVLSNWPDLYVTSKGNQKKYDFDLGCLDIPDFVPDPRGQTK